MTPEALQWVERFGRHLRHERRLSGHTSQAYDHELAALVAWCDAQRVDAHGAGEERAEAVGGELDPEQPPVADADAARRQQQLVAAIQREPVEHREDHRQRQPARIGAGQHRRDRAPVHERQHEAEQRRRRQHAEHGAAQDHG